MEGTEITSGYAANPLFTNGAAHVRTTGSPADISTILFAANALGDCMSGTLPAIVPVTTDICWANGLSGKTKAKFIFHSSEGATPAASGALVMINNGSEAAALAEFARPDQAAQAAAYTTFKTKSVMLSPSNPVEEFDVAGATIDSITSIAVGFVQPITAGTQTCWVEVILS